MFISLFTLSGPAQLSESSRKNDKLKTSEVDNEPSIKNLSGKF
jgi:hypothetical protein